LVALGAAHLLSEELGVLLLHQTDLGGDLVGHGGRRAVHGGDGALADAGARDDAAGGGGSNNDIRLLDSEGGGTVRRKVRSALTGESPSI
jgi:hypothetical protein